MGNRRPQRRGRVGRYGQKNRLSPISVGKNNFCGQKLFALNFSITGRYYFGSVSKHDRTLREIFDDPVRAGINWSDVESLLKNKGASITEGAGSRVRIALNGVRAVFHRPHPEKETDKGAVKSMRKFLTEAAITP